MTLAPCTLGMLVISELATNDVLFRRAAPAEKGIIMAM